MKAIKTIMTSMTAMSVMVSSCQKSMENVPVVVQGQDRQQEEILLEILKDTSVIDFRNDAEEMTRTKSSGLLSGTVDSVPPQKTDTSAFMVTLTPMDELEPEMADTKASALGGMPATLKWLCTTGAAGSQSTKWSENVTVSDGKARTGHFQTQVPTSYSHYVSNIPMAVSAGGVYIDASGDTDIIAGMVTSSSATPSVTMKHILARTGSVSVNLPADAPADCSIADLYVTIKAVTGGMSGIYNLDTGSWSGVSGLTTAVALTGSSDMYLIPGQYTVSVSFTLKKGTGGWNVSRTGTITLKAGCVNNITLNNSDVVTHEVEITKYSGDLKVGSTSWFLVKYYTRTNGVKDAGADVSGHAETTITASNSNVKFYYPSVSSDYTKKNGVIGVSPGNVRLTATYGGVSGYIDVTIADKTLTKTEHEYANVKFTLGDIADVPATGGTSAPPAVSNVTIDRRDKYTWSDGTVTYGDYAPVSLNSSQYSVRYSKTNVFADFSTTHTGFTAANLGTTNKVRTKLGTMYVIVLAMASGDMPDVYSATQSKDVYQAANNVYVKGTWYEYSKPWFSLGDIADVSAAGGTSAKPTVSSVGQQRRLVTWWSNDAKDYGGWENISIPDGSYTISYSNNYTDWSETYAGITAGSLGSTVKARTKLGTIYVSVKANNVWSEYYKKDVYQQANAVTNTTFQAGTVTFTMGAISDVPASGGTSAAPSISGISQQGRNVYTYTSGQKANGEWFTFTPNASDIAYNYSKDNSSWSTSHSGYSGSNLGYTAKARTKLGTMYTRVWANGQVSASQSKEVYQAANNVTYSDITISQFSYATPAWNSTETVNPTLTYSQTVRSDALPTPAAATGLTKTFSHSNTSEFSMNGTTGGIKVDAIPMATVWDAPVISNFVMNPNPVNATAANATAKFNWSQNQRRNVPVRTDVATVTVSGNGKSATKTATRMQPGNKDVVKTDSGSREGMPRPGEEFDYTISLSAVTDVTGFSVNNTGLFGRWAANSGAARSAQVKLTFTRNDKTTTAYATSTQKAATVSAHTVVVDKTQLYVELCHQSSGGTTYDNYGTDRFTVTDNGTDVTSSCTKSGYDTSVVRVDANGTVHFVGDGETTISVSYRDASGTNHSFSVHVRAYEYWESL